MQEYALSYLMGATQITNQQLTTLGIEIVGTSGSGARKLRIPLDKRATYIDLIKDYLDNGFWNEIVAPDDIDFVFKHKNGNVQTYVLDSENQPEIAALCSEFNGDPLSETKDIIKYLGANDFYKAFINKHYS